MFYRIVLGSIILLAIYLLVIGHPVLVTGTPMIPNYKLGNLITWMALIAISLLGLSLIESSSKFRYPIWLSLFLAILWVPGSALITGNFNNEFSPDTIITFETWMYLSGISVLLTVASLISYYLFRLSKKLWQ